MLTKKCNAKQYTFNLEAECLGRLLFEREV